MPTSGMPRRPSCWRPCCTPRRCRGAPWATWCAGSTNRRSSKWPTRCSAPAPSSPCRRLAPPGAVTNDREAPSTPPPRPPSSASPTRRCPRGPGRQWILRLCSTTEDRCTCAPPPTSSADSGPCSAPSPRRSSMRPSTERQARVRRSTHPCSWPSTRPPTWRHWPSSTSWRRLPPVTGSNSSPCGRTWPRSRRAMGHVLRRWSTTTASRSFCPGSPIRPPSTMPAP